MSTQTSLKGRWVKALINCPVSISSWRQGEYRKINSDNGCRIEGGYSITPTASYCEIMPEGFDPNEVKCPINVMDASGTFLKIGDRVSFSHGGHNSTHKWYDRERSLKQGDYIIQDIDLDSDGSGVLKLNNNAARSSYCKKQIHEFKRGGWYRTIGTQFTTNKYIKFLMFDHAKKVVYSERITHAGEHHTFKAEHNYQRSSIAHPTESLVLVPDEEVAEYINKINNSFPIY